jgi:hypothetical protein
MAVAICSSDIRGPSFFFSMPLIIPYLRLRNIGGI